MVGLTGFQELKIQKLHKKQFYHSKKLYINIREFRGDYMAEIIIQKGDTLSKLAKIYGISTNDIAKANGISDPNKINAGQKIVIPDLAPIKESAGIDSVEIKQNINNNKVKEQKFLNIINKHLNIPNYKSSVETIEGKTFLRLDRPADDEYQPDKRHYIDFDSIKENLRIEDGVLNKYNDLADVSNSRCWNDDNTIEPGKSLYIPLDAIGQKKTLFFEKQF